jgi:hypothetical protein
MKTTTKSLLWIVALTTSLGYAQSNNIPQIQHVIIVIQENRTPTNLFHEDANLVANGAHVIPHNNQGNCGQKPMPVKNATWSCTDATPKSGITLTGVDLNTPADPDHSHYPAWYCTYDAGKLDGACHIKVPIVQGGDISTCPGGQQQYCPYTYIANIKPPNCRVQPCPGILDPYFNIAEQYGFANWMFSTHQGPSLEAHLFLFAGTSAPDVFGGDNGNYWQYFVAENGNGDGCVAPAGAFDNELPPAPPQNPLWTPNPYTPPGAPNAGYPCWNPNTLADLLDTATPNVSWRYYAANKGFSFWNAPREIQHICQPSPSNSLPGEVCTGYDYINKVNVGGPGQVLNDLGASGNCDLQQVTWVIPDGNWSDHPGTGSTDAGPSWVGAIVNAVNNYNNDGTTLRATPCSDTIKGQQVPYSQDTVVIVTWDDWGGFYDDVLPWRCSPTGVCNGFPGQLQSADYAYGFRVPLLVVGAYLKQVTAQGGYISGTPGQGGEVPPYVHDFGSILNFIEYAFGQGGNPLGGTGGISPQYFYADWLAPDGPNTPGCTRQQCPYGLSDFFNFSQLPRNPTYIPGYKYNTSCFLNPQSCFGANYPADPDDDVIDPQ